jgi:hypothetical protein
MFQSPAELKRDRSGAYAKLWAHQSDGYIVEETSSLYSQPK